MKTEILGITKNENIFIASIKKDKNTIANIVNFLEKIGLNIIEANKIRSPLGNTENNYTLKKYSNELYSDAYFYLQNNSKEIVVSFGDKRAIITIFSKNYDQKELQKYFDLFFKFDD